MKRKITKTNSDYLIGREAVLENIIQYAHEVLPETIADASCPKEVKTIYEWYRSGKLAREKKRYQREADITHVDSGGSALIKSGWRYPGDESFANGFLHVSLSRWEKEKHKHCKPDFHNGRNFYDPASYSNVKAAVKNGTYDEIYGNAQTDKSWTDVSGSY